MMCAIDVIAGEKGSFWKQSGTEGGSAQRWLERRDVATSRRPHVGTSQRHDVGVNIYRSQQAETSRRLKVATSQRRDVSASSASQSLNAKRGREFRGSEIEERTN